MALGKWMRWSWRLLLACLAMLLLLALALWLFLRGSLAQLDGELPASGLTADVTAVRDALGVPTIGGNNRLDVAYATGYLHAQERYFQMDLMRRVAAGELAGLIGEAALESDREHRFHRFRARAVSTLAALPEADRQLLQRYAAGVNAGLSALHARPFEYGLLRTQPAPWQPADSLLVVWAMYFDLQGNQERRELARGWLKDHSTAEQLAYLLPESSSQDAPLDMPDIVPPPTTTPAQAPAWLGLPVPGKQAGLVLRSAVGSNSWALAGSRSTHGSAIVANDMHLGLRLPHIWYRAVLQYPDEQGQTRRIAGVTLPGAPLVVAGSNGKVAWGFTNSYGDYLDLIEVERDPSQRLRIKTAAGWETASVHTETLQVKGGAAVTMQIAEGSQGPLREVEGRWYAVRWIAHQPGAVNLNLRQMESAADLAAAQAVAHSAGMPAQNMVAGDAAGHIGWTIAGTLPGREALPQASFPYPISAGLSWQGRLSPRDYPRLNDPAGGQLWTANSRPLGGELYRRMGDGGADLGARARQIRDGLTALGKGSELAAYGLALDDRALYLAAWRERALDVLDQSATATRPQRAEFRRLLKEGWTGRASVDSVGYRLTRAYLYGLYAELFGGLDAQLAALEPGTDFDLANPRWPVVVARLLDERPAGWLMERDWRGLELAAIDRAIAELTAGGKPLSEASWGQRNTSRIAHPFVQLLPVLKPWLAAPADAFAGDEHMPRVAGPAFGASQRMVVAPGQEAQGIFNMPGGQSGHPLSPFWLAGHATWVKGEATPFLPGPAQHTLRFVPK